MTLNDRMSKVQEQMNRLQAIKDVYEIIEREYKYRFCVHVKDDNGEYMYDDNGDPVWRDQNIDESSGYPWYDVDRTKRTRDIMLEVLDMVADMK